ncbi:Gfo/Idh/MocA family protein [Saccharopolyspora hattusasensis]|uniref:Gfo/Idh/MocA family protein n=1 Tax=Saccharopolyspora hattusasensis TaxID=1128679 RepID=UPI003D992D13
MTTTSVLRVAVVGLGHMGRRHAHVLRRLDGVRLVAAVDPAGDQHSAAPDVPVLADLDQLVKHGVDYAVLAVPTRLHEPLGLALAAAKIPTLVEKPLAPDVPGARRLVAAFESAGVAAAVGYVERCNPALIALRARIIDGLLGRITHVDTRRSGPYPAQGTDTGILTDLATHDFDTTAWITRQHYRSLKALTGRRGPGHPREDLAAVIGVLDDGTITYHATSWLCPVPHRTTIVTGEHGSLIADTLTRELRYQRGNEIARYPLPNTEPLRTEHERFRDVVQGRGPADVSLFDGLATVRATHAALEAARTGAAVALATDHTQLNAIA